MNSESGSATVWVLGMCVALMIFASAAISASALASIDTAFQGSVDRAALGAADILIGVSAGTPCLYAQELLRREGFSLTACDVAHSSVRIQAEASRVGFTWSRKARAGVINGETQ
jgi:secretion/DNA translocation related TadE-like protein